MGREPHPPYHRPPASKEYLRGEHGPEGAHVHAADWWEPNDVELLTRTSVLELDPAARTAKLSTKEEVGFDHALVATGAMVRRLSRRRRAARGRALPARARQRRRASATTSDGAERVVCVGGSYIASEVAASLTELGSSVTMVMLEDHPLERGFGTTAGRFFRRVLEEHGVEVIGGDEVARFEGDERVERVVHPERARARRPGRDLRRRGDPRRHARAQGRPDPRRAGRRAVRQPPARLGAPASTPPATCASTTRSSTGASVRIEHEEVAAAQGATAARNMLGADAAHDEVPYFFSDLSDWASLEYLGPALSWDDEQVEGSRRRTARSRSGTARAAVVRAMLSVGGAGDLDRARELIRG